MTEHTGTIEHNMQETECNASELMSCHDLTFTSKGNDSLRNLQPACVCLCLCVFVCV